MSYRTIVAGISGGSATESVAETSAQLAGLFGSHVDFLHVRADVIRVVAAAIGNIPSTISAPLIEQIEADIASTTKRAKNIFDRTCERHGLVVQQAPAATGASAAWREEVGEAPELVSGRGRFADLVVLGRSDRPAENTYSDIVEAVLLRSGRPLLLVSAHPPKTLARRIAIGWNGSAEAVRAIAMALPLLREADAVTAVTIGKGATADAAPLLEYLGWHGVSATHSHFPAGTGSGAGSQLLSAARDGGADMLVVGGYSRSPWREYVFGGTSKELLQTSLMPILISH